MELLPGHVYFIKDAFFEFVRDPYLMRNYPTTMRPHYYAIKDGRTGLYWMIPCSSKVENMSASLLSANVMDARRCL